ncbi:MAG: AAA family ATPase [Chloroflexota bacterium]
MTSGGQPTLYILCGLPFAGKTTLARKLVSRFGLSRVAIDDINTERGVWVDEAGLSPAEWARTYDEAYRRIDHLLSQEKSVVDDSVNHTRELRDWLRAIAVRHGARTVVIYVDVPPAEARRRWLENRRTATRNDVRDDDFAQVVDKFEPPAADESTLRYNGTVSLDEWIDQTFHDRLHS